jgi:hypothetical protein
MREAAETKSVATTTERAGMDWPESRVIPPASIVITGELSLREPAGSLEASCSDIAPIPLAGSAASPSANILNTNSNMRLEVTSLFSRKMPLRKG